MARRPRLAPGFTIAPGHAGDGAAVWLVAGEDVRYRLGVADPGWLVALLARCDGTQPLDGLLEGVPAAQHADARELVTRLVAERVLVDGTAVAAHAPQPAAYRVIGSGALADALREN
nr:hypothetical protein [Deltaproteobacteria bacterium]